MNDKIKQNTIQARVYSKLSKRYSKKSQNTQDLTEAMTFLNISIQLKKLEKQSWLQVRQGMLLNIQLR